MLSRFALGSLVGFLFIELAVRALSPVFGPPLEYHTPIAQAKVTQLRALADRGESIDVFFVGSSTVLEGVDIDAFERTSGGLTAFNGALNAGDTHVMRRFVLEELVPEMEPRLVVYGMSPGVFVEPDDPDVKAYDSAPATAIEEPSWLRRMVSDLYIYRYRNTLREPLTVNTIIRSIRAGDTNQGVIARLLTDMSEHGDTENRRDYSLGEDPIDPPDRSETPDPARIPQVSRSDLQELRDGLGRIGAQLVLAIMPAPDMDGSFVADVESLSAELGLEVIDATEATPSTRFFYDSVHLNREGAEQLGTFLGLKLPQTVGSSASVGSPIDATGWRREADPVEVRPI